VRSRKSPAGIRIANATIVGRFTGWHRVPMDHIESNEFVTVDFSRLPSQIHLSRNVPAVDLRIPGLTARLV
jgi:hypothetical protein